MNGNIKSKKVAVIGLGYVGLPLAALCATKGYRVEGLDARAETIESLLSGQCHIRDETVERLFEVANESGNLHPTFEANDIADCDIYLICVP
ncbi:MAG: 3-hydroxyacyl-CoA dehydrogenase NAD-binding domain-containing protein, partial [Pseudomonadota bacterium]